MERKMKTFPITITIFSQHRNVYVSSPLFPTNYRYVPSVCQFPQPRKYTSQTEEGQVSALKVRPKNSQESSP